MKRASEDQGPRQKKKRKAGGKSSKVKQRKEKKALTKEQKREKRITGQSLGRARHVYKVVNGDWPLSPAMYLSDMRSPSMLRPVLLVKDPLNRYFPSPHGNGMQEIMPDRVRNAELRRLLNLSAEDEPKREDQKEEHLELVRMCEARWPKCPLSYEGERPAQFNETNSKRDKIVKEVLLDPINEICRKVGMAEVRMFWVFHCPPEARGTGYYSGKWGGGKTKTVQYTDDKLYMSAYALFAKKYEHSTEGPRPSEATPPGREIKLSWTDDSNVATQELIKEKQLARWEKAVKKRKGVLMRKGDCPTMRRQVIEEMLKMGGDWAFKLEPIRQVALTKKKGAKSVRLSMLFYWAEDRIDFGDQDLQLWKQQETTICANPMQKWNAMSQQTKDEQLAIICFALRTGITHKFPQRYTPLGADVWKPLWDRLTPHTKTFYTYKSVTQMGSLPMLAETLHKHLLPTLDIKLRQSYTQAWQALDKKLNYEHTWAPTYQKIKQWI